MPLTEAPDATLGPNRGDSDSLARVARNATALVASDVVSKGVLFLWQLVLARWLGDSGYGIYGTIGALLAVGASIVEFGMGLIVVREVAKRPQDSRRFLAATLATQPLLAVASYGCLGLAAWLLGYDPALRALLALAAVSLLINALGNICHNQLIAAERMELPAAISVVHVLTLVALAATALWMGTGLWGLYIATLAAGVLRSGLYWLALYSIDRASVGPLDPTAVRELFRAGLPIAVLSFLTLCCIYIDKVLTVALIGIRPAGYLAAAFVISFGVTELLNTTVLVAILPLMSRFAAQSEQELHRAMGKLTLLTLAVGLPVATLISMLATPLCAWLFGEGFLPTADVLRILIWYTCVAMVANVYAQGLVVQNRQKRLMVLRAVGLALAVTLNLLLLPRVGVTGAPVAALVSEAFALVMMVGSFKLSGEWWRRTGRSVFRLALATLGLAATAWFLRLLHPAVAGLAGVPIFGLLLYGAGAIGAEEKDLMRRLLASTPAGGAVLARFGRRQERQS
jgi:O-antigen/teichoic acid export membrane protein